LVLLKERNSDERRDVKGSKENERKNQMEGDMRGGKKESNGRKYERRRDCQCHKLPKFC
jgi:hypothetical protein